MKIKPNKQQMKDLSIRPSCPDCGKQDCMEITKVEMPIGSYGDTFEDAVLKCSHCGVVDLTPQQAEVYSRIKREAKLKSKKLADFIPVEEAQEIAGISRQALLNNFKSGKIPGVKFGNSAVFLKKGVEDYVAKKGKK